LLGTHAIVAEERDAPAGGLQHCGSTRERKRGVRAATRDAEPGQLSPRVGDTAGAAVGNMVSCKRHGVESGALECRKMARIRAGSRYVSRQFVGADGVRNLEVPDREIGLACGRCNAREPMIRLRFIEHQIPREDEIDGRHSAL
jgi:hypothetical protein